MKKIIDEIKTFFKNNNWKYEYNKEDNIFISGLDMGNVLGNVRMFILLEENSYNVYMDYRDGEIRYKSFVNFKNIDVSQEVIEESIIVGAAMIDRYGKGLLKLMLGEGTVTECIEYCENSAKE